jgi:hypothetical protein
MDAAVPAAARIVVVCQLDGFANGMKPGEIARFLRARGHDVQLVDTYRLSRASADPARRVLSRLPGPRPLLWGLYGVEAAGVLARRIGGRSFLSYSLLTADFRLRRRILRSTLSLEGVDLLICETPHDAGVLLDAGTALRLYDCPTPWADELLYEGRLSRRQHARLRELETRLFETVDRLSFHWESYARYAVEHYGISGDNLLTLNWGCEPKAGRAAPATPARVVYLGSLSSRFIDLPLLGRLTQAYPDLDVYGGPAPDPALGLRYRGYADPALLREYQFGVITCTADPLRRDGFSAKHLEYISYGLPVLVPSWRRNIPPIGGSLPYDEDTFAAVVARHSEPDAWQRASDEAYAQAEQLTWDRTLAPLETLLTDEPAARSGGAAGGTPPAVSRRAS